MSTVTAYSKANPFPAQLVRRQRLTGPDSSRSTWHLELDISGSGLSIKPGDAVGILAQNDPSQVKATLEAMGLKEDSPILDRKSGQLVAAGDYLTHRVSIHKASRRLLQIIQASLEPGTQRTEIDHLLSGEQSIACELFLEGRAIWDTLRHFSAQPAAQGIVDILPALTPRFYSIANSPLAFPDQIHLTVADVSYFAHGIERRGVCSHFLTSETERQCGATIPLFLFPTQRFTLPESTAPILMIGPGTGLAPFRAFIQHRVAQAAEGPMWLFFGERNRATDFYYEQELIGWAQSGHLRLSLAFSRDQPEKIYVQHHLLEQAAEVWEWLQRGCIIYVCGDAKVMAKDVQKAFLQIAQQRGGMTPSESTDWLRDLRTQQRYREDVY